MVSFGRHDRWDAARRSVDAPIHHVLIGADVDVDDGWRRRCRLGVDGALLVRPDQHVAWRAQTPVDGAVVAAAAGADAVVMAAAPADFRPSTTSDAKIKKAADGSAPAIELVQNPDILHEISTQRARPGTVVVGFAAFVLVYALGGDAFYGITGALFWYALGVAVQRARRPSGMLPA